MAKISQAEARRLRRRVEVLEAEERGRRRHWSADWPGGENIGRADIIDAIITSYRTDRRWEKAIEHSRDDGTLLGDPRDIGPLMGAIAKDVMEECEQEIRDQLFRHFWKSIAKGVTLGFADFYKARLAAQQFSVTP